jgi:hypothetical protein
MTNKIQVTTSSYIVGFNKVIYKVHVQEHLQLYFVVQRFDGVTVMLNRYQFINSVINEKSIGYGQISNAMIRSNLSEENNILIVDNRINTKTYIPCLRSIVAFLTYANEDKFMILAVDKTNFVAARTGMTKQDFDSIRAKFNMLGTKNIMVDLNTIAIMNKNKILLYTRQKGISRDYSDIKNYI